MRVSVGTRVGPVYIGTGNLLHGKRKKPGSSGLTPGQWLTISPILLIIGAGILLWYAAVGICNGCVWLAWHATHRHVTEDARPGDR